MMASDGIYAHFLIWCFLTLPWYESIRNWICYNFSFKVLLTRDQFLLVTGVHLFPILHLTFDQGIDMEIMGSVQTVNKTKITA